MLWLIKFLIFGHIHKWRPTGQSKFSDEFGRSGNCVYAVCETCGKRKVFKSSVLGDWEI